MTSDLKKEENFSIFMQEHLLLLKAETYLQLMPNLNLEVEEANLTETNLTEDNLSEAYLTEAEIEHKSAIFLHLENIFKEDKFATNSKPKMTHKAFSHEKLAILKNFPLQTKKELLILPNSIFNWQKHFLIADNEENSVSNIEAYLKKDLSTLLEAAYLFPKNHFQIIKNKDLHSHFANMSLHIWPINEQKDLEIISRQIFLYHSHHIKSQDYSVHNIKIKVQNKAGKFISMPAAKILAENKIFKNTEASKKLIFYFS